METELTETPRYMSMRKLIILSFLFFVVPLLGFLFLETQFDATVLYESESVHTIFTLVAAALSLIVVFLGYTGYADSKDIRIMFIIFAFFTFGTVFALHALSLPNLDIASQGFFDLTEHYSLFFVSLLVFVGSSLPGDEGDDASYKKRWNLVLGLQAFIFLFFIVAYVSPGFTNVLVKTIAAPIILTGLLFLGALVKLAQQYSLDHNVFVLDIIFGISVILNNSIIPFFYREWDMGWWYFHFILGLSFLVASFGILISWFRNPGVQKTW